MKRAALATYFLITVQAFSALGQGQLAMPLVDAKPEGKFSAEWRLRLSGVDRHDEQSQSKTVDLRTEFKAKYLLNSNLQLDIQPAFRLQSGQTQSLDGADKPESKISLNQAAVHYLPLKALRLSAGALNQRHMHTQLLMDELAFPAARSEVLYKNGDFKTSLALETAIPTSTSLSTNTKELEATPSLNTAALKFNWQSENNFFWRGSAGYFAFNNLPSAVAQKSGLLGNEVDKISDANFSFRNKFEGLELLSELELPIYTFMDVMVRAEYVQNIKADAAYNSASLYSLGGRFHVTKNTDFILAGGYFEIAPEAAVAYFNANTLQTNRVGYIAETAVAFNKDGFILGLRYTDAELMYSNAVQSREKSLFLKLETFYAGI